jgi:hypothetical protein
MAKKVEVLSEASKRRLCPRRDAPNLSIDERDAIKDAALLWDLFESTVAK